MSTDYLNASEVYNKLGLSGSGSDYLIKSTLSGLSNIKQSPLSSYGNNDYVIDDDILKEETTMTITFEFDGGVSKVEWYIVGSAVSHNSTTSPHTITVDKGSTVGYSFILKTGYVVATGTLAGIIESSVTSTGGHLIISCTTKQETSKSITITMDTGGYTLSDNSVHILDSDGGELDMSPLSLNNGDSQTISVPVNDQGYIQIDPSYLTLDGYKANVNIYINDTKMGSFGTNGEATASSYNLYYNNETTANIVIRYEGSSTPTDLSWFSDKGTINDEGTFLSVLNDCPEEGYIHTGGEIAEDVYREYGFSYLDDDLTSAGYIRDLNFTLDQSDPGVFAITQDGSGPGIGALVLLTNTPTWGHIYTGTITFVSTGGTTHKISYLISYLNSSN